MSRVPCPAGAIVCVQGCCAGCQDCYGMSIGCHQEPCRCGLPCTCRWAKEDIDPGWRDGCERHDMTGDQRRYEHDEPEYVDIPGEEAEALGPCPECGATGACGYDIEGRPLIHAIADDGDENSEAS